MNPYKMFSGILFILIGAIFLSAQYITSAILSASNQFWPNTPPSHEIGNAGYALLALSIVSFIIGALLIAASARDQFES
ncbi:hypothetical protein [Virgibacillus senegalensis]|uniref:hypothetical protein n=1 Tax=Virgibacillus senegalensis TaxID=1499679 RepID=UPI00069DB197|nr:hypothetical protein [Virgibacillus senegalensis]